MGVARALPSAQQSRNCGKILHQDLLIMLGTPNVILTIGVLRSWDILLLITCDFKK